MRTCPACYDGRKGKHTCGHPWHRESESPEPDPLPTEEELARELHRMWWPRPVDKYDDERAANNWKAMDALGRSHFYRQAAFILSHLKPGGWKA